MRFRELRWPCDHPIALRGPDGPMVARLVNLSSHGARILAHGLARGDTVHLDLSPGRIMGTVRWVRGGMVGLRFALAMSVRDMSRIRGHQGGSAVRPKWNLTLEELR